MKRIEEFTKYGKRHIYFDLSYFATNDEFRFMINIAKDVIAKYKPLSVYTIVNVDGIRFDTETKIMVAEWMRYNAKYVKHCVLTGMDGIKKIMLNSVMEMSGRSNISIAQNKERAIELLKQADWERWDKWGQI